MHTVCKASEGPRLGLLQLAQLGGDDLEKEPQRSLVLPFIQAKFPGRPCAVTFDFDEPPTAKEVFEIAVAAKSAGWKIAKEQLEEQSGYTLEEDAAQNPLHPYANGLQNAPQLLNKQVDGQGGEERKTPLKSVEKTDGGDVLAAFAKDTGPAADAIRELLEDPTPEKAKALLDDLPTLLPEDPALAAIIAEEMAKEFSSAASDPSDEKEITQADAERIYEEIMSK